MPGVCEGGVGSGGSITSNVDCADAPGVLESDTDPGGWRPSSLVDVAKVFSVQEDVDAG
jgi:hypothetical protein